MVIYPDELVSEAAGKLLRFDIGRLPVVERGDDRKVVGYLAVQEFSPLVSAASRTNTSAIQGGSNGVLETLQPTHDLMR